MMESAFQKDEWLLNAGGVINSMSYMGHIQHGVVVFNQPIPLPEGTAVVVEPTRKAELTLPAADSWKERSIDDLKIEQGVTAAQRWEDVFGQGASLWDDDRQFDDFVTQIRARRREGNVRVRLFSTRISYRF